MPNTTLTPLQAWPTGGSEIPIFLSYPTEKKLTRHPQEFGKRAIEGVAGPEAASNAAADISNQRTLHHGLEINPLIAPLTCLRGGGPDDFISALVACDVINFDDVPELRTTWP